MKYQNDAVVKRISKDNGCSYDEAYGIFEDTKRFLYLCGTKSGGLAPSYKIDSGWHAFILHTKDYLDFCTSYFGKFIHHYPNGEGFTAEKGRGQIDRTLEFAHNVFGELSLNWNYNCVKSTAINNEQFHECSDTGCNDCSPTSTCKA
jgi:hypothetical protein